ncbi:hypothetical protein ACT02R_32840, partial [Pseudomonas aeruginosa]|uniref:hypothetical protein n=1 Tax=Pseudomonas aeruginosa TaxID=287 RepID=UPI00402B52EA
ECPDQRGITVRMRVEWVSESAWNPHLIARRGHGNEPLPLPKENIAQLRKAAFTTIRTLMES